MLTVVAQRILSSGAEGGIVWNRENQLLGVFTYRDVVQGMLSGVGMLGDVYRTDYCVVEEGQPIEEVDINRCEFLLIKNDIGEITGYLTKAEHAQLVAHVQKAKHKRLDAIFNSAHNGILSIDVEGKITAMNPATERMAKTTKEQSIGKFLNEVVTPTGLLNVIRTGESHSEKFTVGNRKYLAHRSPIFEEKQLIGAVGVFQEISEVELVSSELDAVKQLEQEMDALIRNSESGICIADRRGTILRKNDKFEKLFFYSNNAAIRDDFYQIVSEVTTSIEPYEAIRKATDGEGSLAISAFPILNGLQEVEKVLFQVETITKIDKLKQDLEKAWFLMHNIQDGQQKNGVIAHSDQMKDLLSKIEKAAQTDVTIMLSGELGVEKEQIAAAIVNLGPRKFGPFLTVNCQSIAKDSMEQALFGQYSKTDPSKTAGYFEYADGGTIFLNDIETTSPEIQLKLLHLLKTQTVTRKGTSASSPVDVRVIVGTSEDLEAWVAQGRFNEDLYYLLNVVSMEIPPLRERIEDLPDLLQWNWKTLSAKYNKNLQLEKEALQLILDYPWPGNEQELLAALEYLFSSSSTQRIEAKHVRKVLGNRKSGLECKPIIVNKVMPLREAVDELEKELILLATKKYSSYRQIAQVLEVNPSTIFRKVKKFED